MKLREVIEDLLYAGEAEREDALFITDIVQYLQAQGLASDADLDEPRNRLKVIQAVRERRDDRDLLENGEAIN